VAIPVTGGTPRLLALNGTMPAVSPNSQSLVYHSELIEAEGFHRFDLATGEDSRITQRQYHILPRWGGNERTSSWPRSLGQVAGRFTWVMPMVRVIR